MSSQDANRSPDEDLIAPGNYVLFFAVPGKLSNDLPGKKACRRLAVRNGYYYFLR
jgi:hypothetical protein